MRVPRILVHPVMGDFIIALLVVTVVVPSWGIGVSFKAGMAVSLLGTTAVLLWGLAMVARDIRRRS